VTGTASEASTLPRVQGRHRNRALAGRRRVRALQLVSEGRTYQQVADELGYANKGTVHHLVQQELGAQLVESVAELRQTEVARLNALQVVLWDRAMSGDLQAAKDRGPASGRRGQPFWPGQLQRPELAVLRPSTGPPAQASERRHAHQRRLTLG